jgi:hypothetical protein
MMSVRSDLILTAAGERGFNALVRESVVQALADLLGKSASDAIISHVPIEDAARAPETFHSNLESIFHPGALIVEHIILRELYRRLGAQFVERSGTTFAECMHDAMQI